MQAALGKTEEARRTIDAVPERHPFPLRYHAGVARVDWESCAEVLDDDARRRTLVRGWGIGARPSRAPARRRPPR